MTEGSAGPDVAADGSAEAAERLLSAFRAGDRAAGYELLGRQASLDQWKEVLRSFVGDPADLDLERIAGSTLGRHPEIVAVFLELLEREGSTQALFIAHATKHLRGESHIIERAAEVERSLSDRNPRVLEETSDGTQALYALLTLPLRTERERWLRWKAERPERAAAIELGVVAEDERLQRLSKERSYRSGTYFHFLRHALANLVLITEINGSIAQRAYALLQRRVADADQQEELLGVVPEDVRRRYLAWALEAKNADAVPRTRFALRMIREHFQDFVSADTLVALSRLDDADVSVDAVTTALQIGIKSRTLDAETAHLLNSVDIPRGERLAAALAQVPARLILAQIAPERRDLLFAHPADLSDDFGRSVARQLLTLPATEIPAVATALETLPDAAVPADTVSEAVDGLLERATTEPAYWDALVECLGGLRFRQAVWAALPRIQDPQSLIRAAITAEPENARPGRIADALTDADPKQRTSLADAALTVVVDGLVDSGTMAAMWPEDLRHLALRIADDARGRADRERQDIEAQLQRGEEAHREALREAIEPLVLLASARAAGNAHLEGGYGRLAAALQSAGAAAAPSGPVGQDRGVSTALPDSIHEELANLGAGFDSDAGRITFADGDVARRVRYLGLLDQRAQRGDPAQRAVAGQLLTPYVTALAEAGIGEHALRNLFEGGALLPVVVQLSVETRGRLLEAVQEHGFEPPPAWLDHPALGDWLRTLRLQSGDDRDAGRTADAATLGTALRVAQDARSALDGARKELAHQRHMVKEAVMRVAAPVFEEIDALIDSYAQLWQGLGRLGIDQVAAVGTHLTLRTIDPSRHEIVAASQAQDFVVRSPGIMIDGEVVARAKLEGVQA